MGTDREDRIRALHSDDASVEEPLCGACLGPDEMQAFIEGRLEEADARRVFHQVETCPYCGDLYAALLEDPQSFQQDPAALGFLDHAHAVFWIRPMSAPPVRLVEALERSGAEPGGVRVMLIPEHAAAVLMVDVSRHGSDEIPAVDSKVFGRYLERVRSAHQDPNGELAECVILCHVVPGQPSAAFRGEGVDVLIDESPAYDCGPPGIYASAQLPEPLREIHFQPAAGLDLPAHIHLQPDERAVYAHAGGDPRHPGTARAEARQRRALILGAVVVGVIAAVVWILLT